MKKEYVVCRVDYVKGKREVVGRVVERRGRERGNNLGRLLVLARRLFGKGPRDYVNIALEFPKDPACAGNAEDPGGIAKTAGC